MSIEISKVFTSPSVQGVGQNARMQFAALCYRVRNGKIQILLITSRGTNRWIIPKGWPIEHMTPSATAAREAWEEAGVEGRIRERCIGMYSYVKVLGRGVSVPCVAQVYACKVKKMHDDFPEAGQRSRKWVGRKRAAKLVHEPELAHLLRNFEPKFVRR